MMKKTVILLGTRGIPAKHGAFEQFAEVFCKKYENQFDLKVFCEGNGQDKSNLNVEQIFIPKINIPGFAIIYDLLSILITIFRYKKYKPTVFIFGYTASPFFFLFNLFKIKYWVNTDGYEYKRDKFGYLSKIYLKIAEKFAVLFAPKNLITDSSDLANYFNKTYNVYPELIAYGYDPIDENSFSGESPFSYEYDICVQRLEPENNIEMIIDGYKDTNRILKIVGPSTPWFDKVIVKNLPKNVHYVGPVYDRNKLSELRFHATYYIHGHSVGGMNPVLIESIEYPHTPILYLTPHNYEVCGSGAYYFYESNSLKKILTKNKLIKLRPDDLHDKSRFHWDSILNNYNKLI